MKATINHKRGIIAGGILAIVLILGIAGFFVWQNLGPKTVEPLATPTAVDTPLPAPAEEREVIVNDYTGWKTYTSMRDGYELKYPPEWIVIKETANDGPYIRNIQFRGGGYPEGYINLRVLRDEGTVSGSTLAPKEWYAKLGVETVQKGPVTFTPDTVEAYTLNGFDAKKAKSVFTEIDEDIFFLSGDVLYEINMYPYGASADPEVKKILDSFTLL